MSVILAEDDPDDQLLISKGWEKARISNKLEIVEDGEELMAYLLRQGPYAGLSAPCPGLILLDVNMPRKNGFEVLKDIQSHPDLRHIPIVIMTTATQENPSDFYTLGASGFLVKPSSFALLVETLGAVGRYWLNTIDAPSAGYMENPLQTPLQTIPQE